MASSKYRRHAAVPKVAVVDAGDTDADCFYTSRLWLPAERSVERHRDRQYLVVTCIPIEAYDR